MIELRNKATGAVIGTISEEQLRFLTDHMEEESGADRDYYIDRATVDLLEEAGADPALLSLLRRAVGTRGEVDIEWRRL